MTTHGEPSDERDGAATAGDALLASPELVYARKRLLTWQWYAQMADGPAIKQAFPDAVDALAIALQAINLLIVERDEAQKALIVAKLGRIPTSAENTIGTPENGVMHAVLGTPVRQANAATPTAAAPAKGGTGLTKAQRGLLVTMVNHEATVYGFGLHSVTCDGETFSDRTLKALGRKGLVTPVVPGSHTYRLTTKGRAALGGAK